MKFSLTICNLLGQYLLLNSMVLHLRYPNAHTHWFSSLFLYLYLDASDDSLREIITRVIMERFVVHRPHPWGALVTFIELLRNPKYDFWSKDFVRAAPEVGLLLDGVSLSFLSTPNSNLHFDLRSLEPSLYLKGRRCWSVHHLSHLHVFFISGSFIMHCIVLARCHPAFYDMDTVPYYDQHIRLYSAYGPSINAAMTSHCGTPKNIPKVCTL
jgi:CCR4-Not complex component, Not1